VLAVLRIVTGYLLLQHGTAKLLGDGKSVDPGVRSEPA